MLDDWNPKIPKSPVTPFSSVSTLPTSQSDETTFRVGSLTLKPGYNPGTTWIVQSGGEGGEFPTSEIEAVLQAYYTEHF